MLFQIKSTRQKSFRARVQISYVFRKSANVSTAFIFLYIYQSLEKIIHIKNLLKSLISEELALYLNIE